MQYFFFVNQNHKLLNYLLNHVKKKGNLYDYEIMGDY